MQRFNFERLDAARSAGHAFRLETIRRLLERLAQPHLAYPVIHVAGTKGKGSVVTMLASILTAAGHRVGLYRSPHLESIRERIAIGGDWITAEEFADVVEALQPIVAQLDREAADDAHLHSPTFFEIVTTAAFEYFRRRGVDAAVLEVGLGGRLDSTNICAPCLTLITNIGLDHQRQLGNTKPLIAAEKAGIVKPGVPLLCGIQERGPAEVVRRIAAERAAPVLWLGRDFGTRRERAAALDGTFTAWGEQPRRYVHRGLHTGLFGRHQVANAGLAVAAAEWLAAAGWPLDATAIREGLRTAQIDGRFQLFPGPPPIVLDVAHNAMSARVFVQALRERFPAARRRVLIFSASKDKRIGTMLRTLLPEFERIVLTTIRDNPRAASLPALAAVAEQARQDLLRRGVTPLAALEQLGEQEAALAAARRDGSDLVAICGSVFLAGQMLPLIRGGAPA